MLLAYLILTLILGACVGSFLNVLIYRLPEGLSIVHPPSRCPKCERPLAWYDNVPVLGWLWLKGKCRYCAQPISPQYPIIEALTALTFGLFYAACYYTDLRPGFSAPSLAATWPILVVNLILLAGLLAASLIDARYYIIPLGIPWTVTAVAVIVLPLAAMLPDAVADLRFASLPPSMPRLPELLMADLPEAYRDTTAARAALRSGAPGFTLTAAPLAEGPLLTAAFAGAFGLLLAIILLHTRILKVSFAEEEQSPADDSTATADAQTTPNENTPDASPDQPDLSDPYDWPAHPHPRREILKELLFIAFPLAGFILGYFADFGSAGEPPAVRVFAGVLAGYLIGGAAVWFTRILGTLGFGKEAMGLGDVHLMAAVGAVAGWPVAVIAFFIAPFFGIAHTFTAHGLSRLMRRQVRLIPYGPSLALASAIVLFFKEPIFHFLLTKLGLG